MQIDRGSLKPQVTKDVIHSVLWKRGMLKHVLQKHQWDIYDFFHQNFNDNLVINCGRQFGKSTTFLTIAVEFCLNNPGSLVIFAAPHKSQAREISAQKMGIVLETCPNTLKPRYHHTNNEWTFANGSTLLICGTDSNSGDSLRGKTADLILMDEVGFVRDLEYLTHSIFEPMLLRTGGRWLMSSTPPPSMSHPFIKYVREAQKRGKYLERTVYDNTALTKKQLEQLENSKHIYHADGSIAVHCRDVDHFRREHMCALINDKDALIIPEFMNLKEDIVQEWKRPDHIQPYICADWGVKDYDAILFGYVDFQNNFLVIEDEIMVNYQTPHETGKRIKDKLKEIFPNHDISEMRFKSDVDWKLISEIRRQTGISFAVVNKYDRDASINALRHKIGLNEIRINPRCSNLIMQLEMGIWDTTQKGEKKGFIRNATLGHCDLLDALIYMHKEANYRHNPTPVTIPSEQTHFVPPKTKKQTGGLELLTRRIK